MSDTLQTVIVCGSRDGAPFGEVEHGMDRAHDWMKPTVPGWLESSDPLGDLAKLIAPTRFLIHPRWKDGGYTHALVPKELPVSLGGLEMQEYMYCPRDRGYLLYPSGEVVMVQFVVQPEPADASEEQASTR